MKKIKLIKSILLTMVIPVYLLLVIIFTFTAAIIYSLNFLVDMIESPWT